LNPNNNGMNKILFLLMCSLSFLIVRGQSNHIPETDKSPMDMCYFPDNYPVLKIQNKVKEPLKARAIYSRPQKNGRKVFGELLEYGKLWRLGANEATEVEFYEDVKINGKKVNKGRYTLYAIPFETRWTLIINKDNDTWGAFKYDSKKDVLRVDLPVKKLDEAVESFSMYFDKTSAGCSMNIAWDDVLVTLPISL